jgi:hypothetical protein
MRFFPYGNAALITIRFYLSFPKIFSPGANTGGPHLFLQLSIQRASLSVRDVSGLLSGRTVSERLSSVITLTRPCQTLAQIIKGSVFDGGGKWLNTHRYLFTPLGYKLFFTKTVYL